MAFKKALLVTKWKAELPLLQLHETQTHLNVI